MWPHGTTGVCCCRDCCLHGECGTFWADFSCLCEFCSPYAWGEYFSRMQAVLELARLQQLYEASILAKWPILQCPGSQHKPPFAFKSCPVGINSAQCTSFRGKSCSRRQRYFSKIVLHESFGAASSTVITL